ncbi:MAG: hypothetical protein JNK84_02180 [Phreatobacter sp.]|uniref:hypothetical protein n=1 Tax=Phreatobacter sp. TaxID=1966341 RepID=UPI001A52B547|nr:hypothetical protein [Phreatobacter sp.]MBL8567870.1 hypothetical protein [Phreatobacter sp.]
MDPQSSPADRSLKNAIRAIRIEEAERTGVVVALREADLVRLEILHERLRPVLAEVPRGIELFDAGITPGETPRLWIDMIAFVEMGRDKRTYRFLQDTRNGRRIMAESEDAGAVAERITAYVASRLIERERMLALPPVSPLREAPVLPRADMPAATLDRPQQAVAGAEATSPMPQTTLAPAAIADAAQPDAPTGTLPAAQATRRGISFSGLGGFVLFLLGVAAGAGGLLAVAQLATRL